MTESSFLGLDETITEQGLFSAFYTDRCSHYLVKPKRRTPDQLFDLSLFQLVAGLRYAFRCAMARLMPRHRIARLGSLASRR